MFNICSKCGEYRPDKAIVTEESYAVCPCCGFQHKFIQLPLFILSGASGTGKSTICRTLAGYTKEVVVMESDILWRRELEQPKADLRKYRETWLRVCKNISQSGKPVILCGSEIPANLEGCVERRYFSEINYLALICEDDILDSRLRSRPTWRGFTDELINEHISFNRWFKSNAYKTNPPITLLDTSNLTIDKSVEEVARWINLYLKA